jgi:cytochrome c biogenesis protein CcmG, thiol:disulfide interchange protein DsbE
MKKKNKLAISVIAILITATSSLFFSFSLSASATTAPSNCASLTLNSNITYQKTFTTLPCLVGSNKYALEELKGPLIINVFGSWCPPCREELPSFIKAYATGKVKIVGIDVDEPNKATPIKFVSKIGITWPVLFDSNDSTKSAFGPGVPVTWFLNTKSQVAYKQIGFIPNYATLKSEVKKYLGVSL